MTEAVKHDSIFDQMQEADGVLIDDYYFRYFNFWQFDEGADIDDEHGVALEAGHFKFTFAELKKAKKVGFTWFFTLDDDVEDYQITFEKCTPF